MSTATIFLSKEDVKPIYVKEWVLNWCKENHPEVFIEAEKETNKLLEDNENLTIIRLND